MGAADRSRRKIAASTANAVAGQSQRRERKCRIYDTGGIISRRRRRALLSAFDLQLAIWPWYKELGSGGFLEAGDTQMQGLNPRSGPVSPILVASILLIGSTGLSWSQEKIGDAQTILNNVEGNLPTGKKVPVAQGDAVFVSEGVSSGADSKANLVLNDRTGFNYQVGRF